MAPEVVVSEIVGVPDPPALPHCTRQLVLRGGNQHKLRWTCRHRAVRLIECRTRSPEIATYFLVPPCSNGTKSVSDLLPGTITDLSGKVAAHTPPYPFPDRPLFSQDLLGRERVKTPLPKLKPKAQSKATSSTAVPPVQPPDCISDLDKRIADLEVQLEKANRVKVLESNLSKALTPNEPRRTRTRQEAGHPVTKDDAAMSSSETPLPPASMSSNHGFELVEPRPPAQE
jgi:hypothetical protein